MIISSIIYLLSCYIYIGIIGVGYGTGDITGGCGGRTGTD